MLGTAFFVIGGLIGFHLRPAAPLIGQLPFNIVLTRGSSLTGFDAMLTPLAQQSFNAVAAGCLIGAFIGGLLGYVISVPRTTPAGEAPLPKKRGTLRCPKCNSEIEGDADFCDQCAAPLKP